jgi:hypothetical protein
MRLYCYHCYSDDPDVLDQLARYSHHYSVMPLGIRFYLREDCLCLALLVDSYLERREKHDLIV